MKQTKTPFFAKFLENQISKEAQNITTGGKPGKGKKKDQDVVTMKFPSDDDEDILVTMKFPSDNDEDGSTI